MTFPLEGIKVLDVGEYLAAPGAAAVLGDWGAEVIKIESPQTGDRQRGIMSTGVIPITSVNYLLELTNRNKRSIALDIRVDRGRQVLRQLVERSDIFITNFLADTRRQLHVEYGEIAAINPRIIYVRINGYGQRGPESERPGYDFAAFWSRAGFSASLGEPGAPPIAQIPGIGDLSTAGFAAGAASAKLFERERTGKGALVDLSLLGSGVWVNSCSIMVGILSGKGYPRLSRAEMGNPLWNIYRTRDGKWFHLNMLISDPYWPGFCRAIDRQDLERHPKFASHIKRGENNRELIAILDQVFATRPLEEWARRLDEHGCIWARIQEVNDLDSDPQVAANQYLIDVDHPTHGPIKLAASPVRFDDRPVEIRMTAPEVGQHTEEVLLELGYNWEDLVRLKDEQVIL